MLLLLLLLLDLLLVVAVAERAPVPNKRASNAREWEHRLNKQYPEHEGRGSWIR